jgi:hypothetical protein
MLTAAEGDVYVGWCTFLNVFWNLSAICLSIVASSVPSPLISVLPARNNSNGCWEGKNFRCHNVKSSKNRCSFARQGVGIARCRSGSGLHS